MDLDKKDIIFAIKLKYGTVKNFAKEVGVSTKMIHLYIDEYYLMGIKPRWTRRKKTNGSYYRFERLLKKALKKREEFFKDLARKYFLSEEQVLNIAKDIIDKLVED